MKGSWWVREQDLNDEQKAAVDSIPIGDSYFIVGAPGSGKTNVLLLRSKYLRAKGVTRIRFVTFTSTLRNYVRLGGEQYKLNSQEIVTMAQLFTELLSDNGVYCGRNDKEDFGDYRKRLSARTAELLQNHPTLCHRYDVLLVDEAQDYTQDEVRLLHLLSKVIIGAGDESQRIYEAQGALAKFQELVGTRISLPRHYRNGKKICLVADALFANSATVPSIYPTAHYNEEQMPSSVSKFVCADFPEQVKRIIEEVGVQLRAYPDELIGILFPKNSEVDAFCTTVKAHPEIAKVLYRVKDEEGVWSDATRLVASTIHSAKGLEFRAVHVGCCESIRATGQEKQKNLAFTAVTRAKTSLRLYWTGRVPPYLTDALQKADAEVKDVTWANMFE